MQISDSSTELKESPFRDQGQHNTKDIIGRFNSATTDGLSVTLRCLFWQDNSAWTFANCRAVDLNALPRALVVTSMDSSSTVIQPPPTHDIDSNVLRSVVEHVFMPPKLPQKDPGELMEQNINVALCGTLIEAAQDFLQYIPSSEYPLWMRIIKMMESVRRAATVTFKETELLSTLLEMAVGGMSNQLSQFFLAFGSSIPISIRRICNAYSCPKRRSRRAQTLPRQLRSVRGVRGLAKECRCHEGQRKAPMLLPRASDPGAHEYLYGRMFPPGTLLVPRSNGRRRFGFHSDRL